MKTLDDWLAHAERLHPANIALGLERVRTVWQRMGLAFACPVFTVAGTNGKGSTCAMLESILQQAGYRTGVYTSPHLVRFEERCRLLGAVVGAEALRLGLAVHVETSSTEAWDLARTVAIAHAVGAAAMRCYPRHEGRLSTVIARTIENLRGLAALDPADRLRFTLEQHEDLTSAELIHILKAVDNPRLGLLFDFGNMVNAGEMPLAALQRQAPWVREVHVKDCLVLPDRGGWAHRACRSGEGHLPMQALAQLVHLEGMALGGLVFHWGGGGFNAGVGGVHAAAFMPNTSQPTASQSG